MFRKIFQKSLDVLNDLDRSQGQTHSFLAIDFRDTDKLKEEVNLLTWLLIYTLHLNKLILS